MATETSVTLNQNVTPGANVAVVTDTSGRAHQEVVLQTQLGLADPVTVSSVAPLPVSGNVLDGAADSGGGVKVAGVYNAAPPSLSSGQRESLQVDSSGFLKVNIAAGAAAGGTSSTVGAAAPGVATAAGATDGTNLRLLNVDGSGNLKVNVAAGAAGGTSSNVGSAVPTVATAVGFSDGTNLLQLGKVDASGFIKVNVAAGAAGGTASNFGSAVPALGTAIGFSDGTNLQLGRVDGSGNLKINVAAGGVPSGQDNTSFTAGTTQGLPMICVADSTNAVGAVTQGNQGIPKMTVDRHVLVAPQANPIGGWSPVRVLAAASNNATLVKAGPGSVGYILAVNVTGTVVFLKLYNKVSAPSPAADSALIVATIPIPANTSGAGVALAVPAGIAFSTGIGLAIVANIADADNTSIAANSVVVNLGFI